ncbi:MAG TPA: serine hydrolase domain-containing protein [Chitinophagaceae bacterium]|jgi:CubicO group peptidase (beta-lactamase class C family)|nr:serine hydrolase domain-containing protein [Chitinophagaceae bacterium]
MRYWLFFLLFMGFKTAAQPATMLTGSLDSLFGSYFKANEPGGAVLLVKDNRIIYRRGFGIADIQTKEAITPSTLFNIGSISKTFVAYGILKLAEEKKLSLDDNLYRYFPDFKNPAIAKKVKIVHLLTHTSGLPDSRPVKEQHDFYLVAKDEENFAPLKQTEELESEPGTRYKYSNPSFNGLALIIEKITGQKWQDYINTIIFRPAGMTRSTITDGPHPASGVAHAYIKNKEGGFEEMDYGEETTFAAAGNGGVWSSVDELWKYEQAIQQFTFLDKDAVTRSRTVYPFPGWKDSLPSNLGLSWFMTREMNLSMTGHTGSQGGFISDYCWLPEKKLFYVLLCNLPQPRREIRAGLFSLLERYQWLEEKK